MCLALIVDEHGQKMSKSKGNVIDPWDIFDTHGADALRWYFFSPGQPWTPAPGVRRRHPRGHPPDACSRSGTCYSFFATYADLDGWEPDGRDGRRPTHVLDRWILSELDDTVAVVTDALEGFDALAGATRIGDASSTTSRTGTCAAAAPRFWKASDADAHATLHECLVTIAQLLAPFCPFLADEIHTTPHRRAARCTSPTGPSPRAATTPPWPSRWPRPAAWSASAGPPAPTPR